MTEGVGIVEVKFMPKVELMLNWQAILLLLAVLFVIVLIVINIQQLLKERRATGIRGGKRYDTSN